MEGRLSPRFYHTTTVFCLKMGLNLLFLRFKVTLGEKDSDELRRKKMKQDGARNKTVLVRLLAGPSFPFPLISCNFISSGVGLKKGLYYSMGSLRV